MHLSRNLHTVCVHLSQNCTQCVCLDVAYIKVGSGPFSVTAFHDGIDGLRLDYLEVVSNSNGCQTNGIARKNIRRCCLVLEARSIATSERRWTIMNSSNSTATLAKSNLKAAEGQNIKQNCFEIALQQICKISNVICVLYFIESNQH